MAHNGLVQPASFYAALGKQPEVGITNVGAKAMQRSSDSGNVLIAGITSDSDNMTRDFIGVIPDSARLGSIAYE